MSLLHCPACNWHRQHLIKRAAWQATEDDPRNSVYVCICCSPEGTAVNTFPHSAHLDLVRFEIFAEHVLRTARHRASVCARRYRPVQCCQASCWHISLRLQTRGAGRLVAYKHGAAATRAPVKQASTYSFADCQWAEPGHPLWTEHADPFSGQSPVLLRHRRPSFR